MWHKGCLNWFIYICSSTYFSTEQWALFSVGPCGNDVQEAIHSGFLGQRLKVPLTGPMYLEVLSENRNLTHARLLESVQENKKKQPPSADGIIQPQDQKKPHGWWSHVRLLQFKRGAAASEKQITQPEHLRRPENGGADLNWGMTILCSDTTSFGLLVACIPRLGAGKTPPRDPKIYSRAGLDPASHELECVCGVCVCVGVGERGRARGQSCKPGQAIQFHRPQITVRLTTQPEC